MMIYLFVYNIMGSLGVKVMVQLVLLGQLDQQVLSLHQLRSQGKPLNQRAVLLASLLASLLSQHQWDPLLYPRLSPLHLDLHLEQ
jgi:hypothetical protein